MRLSHAQRSAAPRLMAWAAALAVTGGLVAAAPPPVAAADGGLVVVAQARYQVLPADHRIHVTIDALATSLEPDAPDGRVYYSGITFAVPAGVSNIAASSGGRSIGARVQSADDDFTAIEVTFDREVFYRQTYPYTVSFDLVDPGGAGTRDLRIGSSLAAFPVWAFGTQGEPGGSVRVELPEGYTARRPGQRHGRGRAARRRRAAHRSARRPAGLLRLRLGRATWRLRQQDDEPGRPRHARPAADPGLGRRPGVGPGGDQSAAPRAASAAGPDRDRLPGQRPAQRGRGRHLQARRIRGHLQPRDRRDPRALRRRRFRDAPRGSAPVVQRRPLRGPMDRRGMGRVLRRDRRATDRRQRGHLRPDR